MLLWILWLTCPSMQKQPATFIRSVALEWLVLWYLNISKTCWVGLFLLPTRNVSVFCVPTSALQAVGKATHRADRVLQTALKPQLRRIFQVDCIDVERLLVKHQWYQLCHISLDLKMLHSEFGLVQSIQTDYTIYLTVSNSEYGNWFFILAASS